LARFAIVEPGLSYCYCLKYQLEYSVITNRNHTEEGIRQGVLTMKMHALLITSGLLFAITGAAKADDHLFEATQHGLTETSTGFIHGDHAPGQGSPFTGADRGTPSVNTDTSEPNSVGAASHAHAGPSSSATGAPGHNKN
jgi:hypothetical protein